MNFGELKFWLLLSGCLFVCLLGRMWIKRWSPGRMDLWDRVSLLVMGWVLLLSVSVLTFGIFLWVALVTYFGVKLLQACPVAGRQRWLIALVPLQLGPLFYFKYADFVCNGVFRLGVSELATLVIPAGISFYSFQKVSFAIDTLARDQRLPRLLDYMNFAGFFPLVVAGPIERKSDLLPQMERFRFEWNVSNLTRGVEWIVLGLFLKMVLADNLAQLFHPGGSGNAYAIWYANLVFGLRIYFDFAGYSLVALGIAGCLGVRLTVNFLSPYCAVSVGEFWRRWHVSLSQWFRDYLYIPLGGAGRGSGF